MINWAMCATIQSWPILNNYFSITRYVLSIRSLSYLTQYLVHGAESALTSQQIIGQSINSPYSTEPQVCYCLQTPVTVSILRQMNSVRALTSYFLRSIFKSHCTAVTKSDYRLYHVRPAVRPHETARPPL
jgi:hypothetical protein